MIANRFISVAAALVCLSLASPASAGDHGSFDGPYIRHLRQAPAPDFRVEHFDGRHRRHFVENRRWDRQGDGRRNRPAEIARSDAPRGYLRARPHQLGGFYGGGVEAYPVAGNGIYFLQDGYGWGYEPAADSRPVPTAKVIDVDEATRAGRSAFADACSYEHGVCIIRGGR